MHIYIYTFLICYLIFVINAWDRELLTLRMSSNLQARIGSPNACQLAQKGATAGKGLETAGKGLETAGKGLEELGAGDELLGDHAGYGEHREAAVVDLLGLGGLEASWVLGHGALRLV
jgi:hypothetical protein